MPPGDSGDITPGELGRRMQDVLTRFGSLVETIETRYVRKDLLDLYKEGIASQIAGYKAALDALEKSAVDKDTYVAEKAALEKRVSELEDSNKWLFRLVVGFIILAVLGAVFTAANFGGGGGG